jgi:hypothetical protein
MHKIDTYDQDRARRARIEAEYKERVRGQNYKPLKNRDDLTGMPTGVCKTSNKPASDIYKIKIR